MYINLVGPVDVNGFNELTEPMCKPNIRFALIFLYSVETVLKSMVDHHSYACPCVKEPGFEGFISAAHYTFHV